MRISYKLPQKQYINAKRRNNPVRPGKHMARKASGTPSRQGEYGENENKAMYACMVCKSMFRKAGMCPNCDQVLKKKAG